MFASRARRSFALLAPVSALSLATLAGCWTRDLPTIGFDASTGQDAVGHPGSGGAYPGNGGAPGTGGTGGGTGGAPVFGEPTPTRKLDVLFMVDNSASMAPLQAK